MDLFKIAELAILFASLLFIVGSGLLGKKAKAAVGQAETGIGNAFRNVGATAERRPGEVLDSMMADVQWVKTHTDAPPEVIKAFEAVAGYLMHDKGSVAAPQATVSQGA